MSKVDWQSLAMRHDRSPDQDFPEWLEAIEDLKTCEDSRREAIDSDPLMMFQALPEGESSEHEIAAMKDAVAQLRRVGDLPARVTPATGFAARMDALRDWLSSPATSLPQWQAAAALLLVAAATWWIGSWAVGLEDGAVQAAAMAPALAPPALSAPAMVDGLAQPAAAPWVPADLHHQPLVEDAGPSAGELIQIEDAEVSLVVVLPGGSDSEV